MARLFIDSQLVVFEPWGGNPPAKARPRICQIIIKTGQEAREASNQNTRNISMTLTPFNGLGYFYYGTSIRGR